MIPFFPKFGSEEDAPGYGPSGSGDACEKCAFYRNLGNQGYCERFSFLCRPEFVCDDFVVAGTVKESSDYAASLAAFAKEKANEKKKATTKMLTATKRGELKKALSIAEGDLIPETKHTRNMKAIRAVYGKEKKASAFLASLDPLAGDVAKGAIEDSFSPDVSAEDMRRNRNLATLGGAISGGVLVPAVVSLGVGGGRGALTRGSSVRQRLARSVGGARQALEDTFVSEGAPALIAGGGLGALGTRGQYDLGTGIASAYEKKASLKTYGTFGGLGATALGAQSLLGSKDRAISDLRLHRRGKISDQELSRRMKEYGGSAAINAAVGAGLGMGATFGARKFLKPELTRMGDEVATYANKKVSEGLKSVDDLATKHRKASADEARQLANEQRAAYSSAISRKGDELVDKMQNADLLKGTRKGVADSTRSLRDRLRGINPFSREDKYSKLNQQFAAEEAAEAARKAGS